jgi:penicillin-binding protein 1A
MVDPQKHLTAARAHLDDIRRAHRNLFRAAIVTTSILTLALLGAGAWLAYDVMTGLPNASQLQGMGAMAQATTLYDDHDRPAFTIFQEQRIDAPLRDLSPHLVRAIIAIEDQRFYDHGGIDVLRIAGAALTNVRARRAAQGGSTLTQQLARQSFLTFDKTIRRKLKEAVLAVRLEHEFTKDQILEMYLNKVYFGDGLYGAEAASLGFFGKDARDLDVAEAALLAGLVKSPSTYAPTVSLDRAIARRNVVLQAMRDSRAIDDATYKRAVASRPHLRDALRSEDSYGQYFKEEVRKQLVQRFGWDRVYQSGLRVYTTIDLDMQKAAEAQVAAALKEIEQRQLKRKSQSADGSDPLQAALVAMDPQTGQVRAMVGGRSFDSSRFNRATQARRQSGSAFKPFIYAAALEQGFTAASLIGGLATPIDTRQGRWVPADEHLSSDTITMREALRTSSNRAAVQMLQQVGIPTGVTYAARFGIADQPAVPSLALGSGDVTLLSMTSAYSAFANGGMVTPPSLIRRVEDASGHLLYESDGHATRAVSEATAFIMTSMLSDVINAGTAWQARTTGFALPAAGKTGTTNDYNDVWFVGYTPHIVAGVWVGYDQPRTILANGYAGDLAVPLWGRFMAAATRTDSPDRFKMPSTVVPVSVCRLSGKLPTDACSSAVVLNRDGEPTNKSMVYTEYFVRGTEPIDYCPLHSSQPFNALATSGAKAGAVAVTTPALIGDSSAPPPPVASSTPPPVPAPPPAPTNKRGFWGRLFRR